jgi:hypothetical protein
MSDSVLQYEEKMWELFDVTKEQMPDLAEAYYGGVKMPYTAMVLWI